MRILHASCFTSTVPAYTKTAAFGVSTALIIIVIIVAVVVHTSFVLVAAAVFRLSRSPPT
jgi:hypothetical protein